MTASTKAKPFKLRLACADFSFPLLSHDDALDLIAKLGFEGVDIGLFTHRSHLQPKDYLKDVPGAARLLSAKVCDRGLTFADIFLTPSTDLKQLAENHPQADQRRKSRNLFSKTLELVTRCNARHITTLPGICWEGESADTSLKRAAEELAWRVEQAERVGVRFSIEPHMWSVAPDPKTAARLIKLTPGLTLTLDYGHYTCQGIADRFVEPLLKHASHFHARCACKNRLQTNMATNTINYARIIQTMKRTGYAGYLGLEYVRMDVDVIAEVDNLSETILLRDLLRQAARRRAK